MILIHLCLWVDFKFNGSLSGSLSGMVVKIESKVDSNDKFVLKSIFQGGNRNTDKEQIEMKLDQAEAWVKNLVDLRHPNLATLHDY